MNLKRQGQKGLKTKTIKLTLEKYQFNKYIFNYLFS